ncbi:MAG: NAD-dependent epimerase/dehydratase family protein [Nitrospira sp. CR1.2]|nr:NAD-dependent epimerase/dehydratase family protein [Nitrospira sp. CR1.2]
MMHDVTTLAGARILVTGGTGFIGSRLLTRLCDMDAHVHAASREQQPETPSNVEWYQGDLADLPTARSLLKAVKPHVIYHLAGHVVGTRGADAIVPTFHCNLASTVNLLTAAQSIGCNRFILSGSLEEPSVDAGEGVPSSPYAVTKWASSAYARMFHALYQFPAVILRVFMVYGPGQRDLNKLIPYVIASFLRGDAPELSSGRRAIDWIYVDDVVDAFLAAALANNLEGKTIDVGSGKTETVRGIVRTIARLLEQDEVPVFGTRPDRPLEQVRVADPHAAEKFLRWTPQVSLEEGLQRTIDWYARNLGASAGGCAVAAQDSHSTEDAG